MLCAAMAEGGPLDERPPFAVPIVAKGDVACPHAPRPYPGSPFLIHYKRRFSWVWGMSPICNAERPPLAGGRSSCVPYRMVEEELPEAHEEWNDDEVGCDRGESRQGWVFGGPGRGGREGDSGQHQNP